MPPDLVLMLAARLRMRAGSLRQFNAARLALR